MRSFPRDVLRPIVRALNFARRNSSQSERVVVLDKLRGTLDALN
tara:strand:- start:341 stop:472 length:132 start_codon:yes stop_codon:yes gene_type:complete